MEPGGSVGEKPSCSERGKKGGRERGESDRELLSPLGSQSTWNVDGTCISATLGVSMVTP